MFVPFAGEHALAANRLKTVADTANPGEQIDKPKGILRVMGRRTGQQVLQEAKLAVAEALTCAIAGHQPFNNRRAPVALALRIELICQRSGIVNIKQLTQQRLNRRR
ncbi:hypothetical protein D3C75_1206810 [compost metagenome]